MLDPDLVLSSLLSAFQSMPSVVTALGGSSTNLVAHTYAWGKEHSLARAVRHMTSPSILIAYVDLLGGQWDAMTVFKHRFEIYLRPKNASSGSNPTASTPMHLWWLMMTSPVVSVSPGTLNIRTIRLLPDLAPVDAMPTLLHLQDEELADLFCGKLVIPELAVPGDV